jgi:hypothetical protein
MGPYIVSIFQYTCISNKMQSYAVTVWQIPDALDTVVCAPDDGWKYHPKHVQQFPDINKLRNVASCWIYIGILLGAHPILHISRIRVNRTYCTPQTVSVDLFWYHLRLCPVSYPFYAGRLKYLGIIRSESFFSYREYRKSFSTEWIVLRGLV